jgi:gliding motility-associated-like protein
VFSPNDDGANDYFNLYGASVQAVNTLRVYDRWGNLVFSKDDVIPNEKNDGWDGRYNDEMMQPGVYVFYAEIVHDDGVPEELIGDITLIR